MVTANEWHADGGGGDWEDAQSKWVLYGEMGKYFCQTSYNLFLKILTEGAKTTEGAL